MLRCDAISDFISGISNSKIEPLHRKGFESFTFCIAEWLGLRIREGRGAIWRGMCVLAGQTPGVAEQNLSFLNLKRKTHPEVRLKVLRRVREDHLFMSPDAAAYLR